MGEEYPEIDSKCYGECETRCKVYEPEDTEKYFECLQDCELECTVDEDEGDFVFWEEEEYDIYRAWREEYEESEEDELEDRPVLQH